MSKKMLIDATHAEETRVVVVDGNKVEEFDFESINKRQLAGNIYLAKVTRVEPSLQAAFVDYGGNRHGFLAFSEIHPDYYQIPVADREALLAEEEAYAKELAEEDAQDQPKSRGRSRRRRGGKSVAEKGAGSDAVVTEDLPASDIQGMAVVDVDDNGDVNDPIVGFESQAVATPEEAASLTVTSAELQADTADSASVPESDADAEAQEDLAEADDQTDDDLADDDQDDDDLDGDQDDDIEEVATADEKDAGIESVAQEDEQEDIRPRRKPRPRRYKIQEVIKVRQILLIQVVKEERGNKGAALTTYLSLAGRYCVLMPNTARGGGISRKITNAADRKKLKEIANDIEVPKGAGLIVRTAGAKRTKAEIKRDYDYLLRQWEQVRDLTLKSIAPAPIYEEGSLIKRSIRDLYNREIDEILIEGEGGYRMAKDYMKMLMPSHAKNVKLYTEPLSLFARFQVESYLSGMFNPTVQLRSGGYIVIGVTEALVAIDVNSGRATKESSIEETALKTNLEAAEEVARQLRLRDLAGLIVIDFIDMEDRRNNAAVEKRIKDKLKTDRARIQVGRISGFGLMEMSRQRLRPGMIEATTAPCPHCHGTGLTRSDDNLALAILRELEEEGVRRRSREVLVTAPIAIANYMLNQKREHVAMIESRYGISIRIEADQHLISPEYKLERFKTATRIVPEPTADVVSMETSLVEAEAEVEAEIEEAPEIEVAEDDTDAPKKKRRRRRRRGGRGRNGDTAQDGQDGDEGEALDAKPEEAAIADAPAEEAEAEKPAPKKRTTRRKKVKDEAELAAGSVAEVAAEAAPEGDAVAEPGAEAVVEAPVKKKRAPRRKPKAVAEETQPVEAATVAAEPVEIVAEPVAEVVPDPTPAPEPTPEPAMAEAEAAPAEPAKAMPKRKGWWSRG